MPDFFSSFDKRPVYIGVDDQALSFGRVFYYDLAAPATLKTIYSDYLCTVAADNPQILNVSGRTETQIFLGSGNYICKSQRFIGTDVSAAEDTDWADDNQWIERGPTTQTSSITEKIVDTIADLRHLVPSDNPVVNVRGYYALGDCYTRKYIYNVNGSSSDNGGTWIRNPIYSGCWELQIESDCIDCRAWGVIPGRTTVSNAQISAMANWFAAFTKNTPYKMYFPSGVYYVTNGSGVFRTPVEFAQNVQFLVTNSGTYYTDFYDRFIYSGSVSFTNASSVGYCNPRFYLSGCVDSVFIDWWLGVGETVDNCSTAFAAMESSLFSDSYIVDINKTYTIANSVTLQLKNRLRFSGSSYINSTGSTLFLWQSPISAGLYGIFGGDLSKFRSSIIREIKSSWYLPVGGSSVESTTRDLGSILPICESAFSSADCTFVYDAKVNLFSTQYVDSGSLQHRYSSGVIRYTGSSSASCKYNNLIGIGSECLDGYFVVYGSETRVEWFAGSSDTVKYIRGVICAFQGNGTLDLCGRSLVIYETAINTSSRESVKIKNGSLTNNDGWYSCIYVTGLTADLTIENVSFVGKMPIRLASGSTIGRLSIVGCSSAESGGNFITNESSVIDLISVNKCTIKNDLFQFGLSGEDNNCTFDLVDNTLQCVVNAYIGCSIVSNIIGKSGSFKTHTIKNQLPCIVANNVFYDSLLQLEAGASGLDFAGSALSWSHSVTGNIFYYSLSQATIGIRCFSSSSGSLYNGLVVSNNVFSIRSSAGVSSDARLITADSNAATSERHRMIVSNNRSNYAIVPTTEGVISTTITAGSAGGLFNLIVDLDSVYSVFAPENTRPTMRIISAWIIDTVNALAGVNAAPYRCRTSLSDGGENYRKWWIQYNPMLIQIYTPGTATVDVALTFKVFQ